MGVALSCCLAKASADKWLWPFPTALQKSQACADMALYCCLTEAGGHAAKALSCCLAKAAGHVPLPLLTLCSRPTKAGGQFPPSVLCSCIAKAGRHVWSTQGCTLIAWPLCPGDLNSRLHRAVSIRKTVLDRLLPPGCCTDFL